MQVRAQIEALDPDDVAQAIAFYRGGPPRVSVAELIVVPTQQG